MIHILDGLQITLLLRLLMRSEICVDQFSWSPTMFFSRQVAQVLFQSARDCLELFMAIVPMQFAHIIEHNARMGAVFYNDCLYIAHNCTLISHTYRAALGEIDPVLSSTVGFLDFIPRLRALGDRCLSRHIEAQRAQLEVLVSHINISPDGTSKPAHSALGLKLPSGSAQSGSSTGSSTGTGLGGRVGLLSGGLALAGKIGSKIKQGLTESEALYNINNASGSDRSRSATNRYQRWLQNCIYTPDKRLFYVVSCIAICGHIIF